MVGILVGQLANCLVGNLVGNLVGWLVGGLVSECILTYGIDPVLHHSQSTGVSLSFGRRSRAPLMFGPAHRRLIKDTGGRI